MGANSLGGDTPATRERANTTLPQFSNCAQGRFFFSTLLRGRFLSRKFPLQNQDQGKEQGPLKDSLKETFTASFSS